MERSRDDGRAVVTRGGFDTSPTRQRGIDNKGDYQRAGRISLGGGCVSCHTNQFSSPSTSPKFAGLVIRIPVNDE